MNPSSDPQVEVGDLDAGRARARGVITEKTLVYRAIRSFWWIWLHLVHRVRYGGLEHLPASGGCVIISNHQSFLDIPLVAVSTSRHVCFLARDTLAESRVLAFHLKHTGAVLVKRGASDRAAMRDMLDHLERGDVVCVFPEGTRSEGGAVGDFQRGATLVARRAGVPLIPCGVRGTFAIAPKGSSIPRPARCSLTYGPPLHSGDATPETLREAVLSLVGDGRFAG